MAWRRLTDAACYFGGVVGTARWQGHVEQLEKPSSSHREIRLSRVGHITGETGKVADGETVADGLVVAENRSNVRGAKEPCCNAVPVAVGEAGAHDKTPGNLQDPMSGGIRPGEDGRSRRECGVGLGPQPGSKALPTGDVT